MIIINKSLLYSYYNQYGDLKQYAFLFERELPFRIEIYRKNVSRSELGIYRWRVSLPRDQGSFTENYDKLKINVGEVLSEYEKFIFWYLEEGKLISDMDIQIESFFRTSVIKGRKINTFKKDSLCCEYKKQALAVKPNGDVVACTAFTNLVIGNLQQDSIGEIWYSEKMQKVKQIKVSYVKECIDCEYLYLCGTGCRRMALSKTGSLFAKDESACEIYKFIHNKIIPMFNEFQLQINFD
ncbi:MAG: SPASM domain-containing protein [Patescibacteria group bacterium]